MMDIMSDIINFIVITFERQGEQWPGGFEESLVFLSDDALLLLHVLTTGWQKV